MHAMKKCLLVLFLLICFKGFSQKIILAANNGDLYSFDALDCKITLLGKTGIGFEDISFTGDGRLWGISIGKLYQIDTLTYKIKYAGNAGFISVGLVELDDTTLIINSGHLLFKLNVNTAATSYLGDIGSQYNPTGDMTWYNDDLYISCLKNNDAFGCLVRVTFDANKTAITQVQEMNKVPGCVGLVTVSLTNENPILGFNLDYVYKICHEDGSYKKICALNLPQQSPSIWGAASMKLPTPIAEKGHCTYADPEFVNVFTPNNDGINDVWEVSGFHTRASVQIFNRWGKQVNGAVEMYAEESYKWDGGNCSSGVYYYIITTPEETYKGFLNLLR
jgi:gliding motility-associated-like protein